MSEAAFRAVSADSHVNPPAEMWAEYLPAEFRDRAPTVERTDEGDFEVFEGQRRPMMALAAAAGRRPEEYTMSVRRFDEVRAGGWEPGPRVEDQDIDGVDAEVLFGAAVGRAAPEPRPGARPGRLHRVQPLARRLLLVRARPPDRDGLHPVRRPRRRHRRGPRRGGAWPARRGAPAPAAGRRLGGRGVGAAVAHDRGAGMAGALPRRRVGEHRRRLAESWRVHQRSRRQQVQHAAVARRARVLRRPRRAPRPQARSAWKVRSGGSRSGSTTSTTSTRSTAGTRTCTSPSCRRPTSSARCGSRSWRTRRGSRPATRCGIDRIMWSNDYPHSETTWPHSQKIIGDIFERVPAEEVRKIVRDNCVELYGLD